MWQLMWLLTGHLKPLDFRLWFMAARGGSVGDKNLKSKVFRPSERNGGVSFAKKWPQSRVSRVATLKL